MIVRLAAAPLARAQVPTRVIVTVSPSTLVVEPVQSPVKPLPRAPVALVVAKSEGKVTLIVRVAVRAPVALALKPTVQVAGALATYELPLNVTLAGVVAGSIVIAEAG